jgi:hypothetical protein
MSHHQKRFQELIEDLTGRIGRCETRDLEQVSLLDPIKTRMVGNIMEYARKHWEALAPSYEDKVRKVSWNIEPRDKSAIVLSSSVGRFTFAAAGHEVIQLKDSPYFNFSRHYRR